MQVQAAYSGLTTEIRGNKFTSDLEDYLDRARRGLGKGSSNVPEELGVKLNLSSSYLANTDPSALKKYSGYLTALSYDKRGRFVSNLDDNFSQLARLSK